MTTSKSAPVHPLDLATGGTDQRVVEIEIDEVVHETENAISLSFRTPEHFTYEPGQFLTLEVPCPDGSSVARCYSFSSSPVSDPLPSVTVKTIRNGLASHWLHDNAIRGMRLNALKPSGMFGPDDWDIDFVLVAAGSGITPMMSIIKTALLRHENRMTLVYANHSRDSVIFAEQLAELQSRFPDRLDVHHWYSSDSGLSTAAGLASLGAYVPTECDAFLCGPPPYLSVAEEWLSRNDTAVRRTHREVFASFDSNPFRSDAEETSGETDADSVTAEVEIDGVSTRFDWSPETKLLDRLLELGLDAPYVCREGTCGGCAYTLTEGSVTLLANETLDRHELDSGVRLACQSVSDARPIRAVFDR